MAMKTEGFLRIYLTIQGGPLAVDPSADRNNGGNDGHNHDAKQNGVFDERGAVFVPAQAGDKTRYFRHDATPDCFDSNTELNRRTL